MSTKFKAALFDELTPCYPDTDVSTGTKTLSVAGANGTYVGVNILMSGITTGIPVTIKVTGESTAYKLFEMIPVPVEVNTGAKLRSEYLKNDHNDNVIRRAPFMVYEVLEPIENIVLPTMSTMAFSFKTVIEYCKKKETQKWCITVSHNGEDVTLDFVVDRYPFTVQKAGINTHKFVNWLNFDVVALQHHTQKWSEKFYDMLEQYLRVAVYSRQNMINIPLDEFFTVDDGVCTLDKDRLACFTNLAQKVGITYFQGGAVAVRALGLADDDDFYNSLDHSKITHSDQIAEQFKLKAFDYFDNGTQAKVAITGEILPSEEGTNSIRSIAHQLNAFIVEHNLGDVWIQCALDEPNDALCETYGIITSILHSKMPNIPIMEPVLPTEKVVGMLDIWCPSLDVYERNRDFFDARADAGDRLFVYSCLTPGGNYCNRLLDLERLRIVWLAWAPAKYRNIKGFLHWGANQFGKINPYKRSATMFSEQILEFHPKKAMFLPAGDVAIFFPGYNEALITVRSEAHRIGYEDLEMLTALLDINQQKANKIIDSVFRGYADYEKSVEKYRIARKELLESLL